ncbi:hypothetical protein [Sideroxydans lithotrophicus]|uniref:Uncharacterized protein n=1 Tax=Sideroxydans lithotrophicus (strain ES-1) TaxID=580332 RepID=D5CN55_SIDLE|nr:hypothetical protein [Sideroxydans lithotrophicus]ADE12752.1 hypothetical protein Slit_2527 [Sideroxydans lithotrophicus ES-1]
MSKACPDGAMARYSIPPGIMQPARFKTTDRPRSGRGRIAQITGNMPTFRHGSRWRKLFGTAEAGFHQHWRPGRADDWIYALIALFRYKRSLIRVIVFCAIIGPILEIAI